mgnify:CR=1 FL=1
MRLMRLMRLMWSMWFKCEVGRLRPSSIRFDIRGGKVEKQTIILHLQKPTAPFSPINCSRFKWYVRITSHLCLPYHFYLVMMLIVNSKSEGSIV